MRYNPEGDNWSSMAEMVYRRLYAASTANSTKGYIIGGYGFMAEALSDLWEYDPVLDQWVEKNTLPVVAARQEATAFSIDENIYVFGGTDGMIFYNDLWKYNPSTNEWCEMSSMPSAERILSLSFVLNNEAYVIGGESINSNLKEVWKYNAQTDFWSQLDDFPGENAPTGGAAFVINGKGYIVPANQTSECWEFNPTISSLTKQDQEKNSLVLYPNPAKPISTLRIPDQYTGSNQIQIFNSSGQLLLDSAVFSSIFEIDFSRYKSGIYVMRLVNNSHGQLMLNFVIE
jgi:N-acetylneuraminic acid mutarotase